MRTLLSLFSGRQLLPNDEISIILGTPGVERYFVAGVTSIKTLPGKDPSCALMGYDAAADTRFVGEGWWTADGKPGAR